ncbi:MAG: hypothetical protein V7609_1525 [Verrucomicrobiota bacterium]
MKPEDALQFIHIDDKLFNLRFVKSVRLSGTTLEVTVPEDRGDAIYMLHTDGVRLFERLKGQCINYAA